MLYFYREPTDEINLDLEHFIRFAIGTMITAAILHGIVWLIKNNGGAQGMFFGRADRRPWSPSKRWRKTQPVYDQQQIPLHKWNPDEVVMVERNGIFMEE
jgi:hypothetical protein